MASSATFCGWFRSPDMDGSTVLASIPGWRRRSQPGKPVAAPRPQEVLNPATWATAQDLIQMQRYAGRIDLTRTRPARAQRGGNHESRFRGRGMDYRESRAYQAGDDVRSIDWRLTARTGAAHTKLYQEERERPVILFLDLHPGMFFGSRGALKSVIAARAAALIAWAAAAHGDRIGAIVSSDGHRDLQARGGKHGVLRLIRELVERTDPRKGLEAPASTGGLNAALGRLRRVSRPGSLIVLLGDYYGIDGESSDHLLHLRQHSDVVAIQIVDPLELASPAGARYGVIAAGVPGILDTRAASAQRAYESYFRRHHQAVASILRSRAIPLLRIGTEDDVGAALCRQLGTSDGHRRTSRHAA